jgi:hypothetical protein
MAKYSKGSKWRRWDLHVHSPASLLWEGIALSNRGDGLSLGATYLDSPSRLHEIQLRPITY